MKSRSPNKKLGVRTKSLNYMTTNLNFMIQMYFQAVTSLFNRAFPRISRRHSLGLGAEGCPLLHNAMAKILEKNMPIYGLILGFRIVIQSFKDRVLKVFYCSYIDLFNKDQDLHCVNFYCRNCLLPRI